MSLEFPMRVLIYFSSLFLLLLLIKIALVIYRIHTGKWPMSVSFLLEIVEWDKEVMKIGFLLLISLLVSVVL